LSKKESIADKIRSYVRAMQGLPSEDEATIFKLMNVKDIRERTRIEPQLILLHSYCRLLAKYGGDEYDIFDELANQLDHYNISREGKNWDAAILMTRQQTEPQQPSQVVTVGNVPQIQGMNEAEQQQQKRPFWSRGKKQ
jgi:hypothetical protein